MNESIIIGNPSLILVAGRHLRFINENEVLTMSVYGTLRHINVETREYKEVEGFGGSNNMNTYPIHSLFDFNERHFVVKKSEKCLVLTGKDLNVVEEREVSSRIRHIIWEKEDRFMIFCSKDVYRYSANNHNLTRLELQFEEIYSGQVIGDNILLHVKKNGSKQIILLNQNLQQLHSQQIQLELR